MRQLIRQTLSRPLTKVVLGLIGFLPLAWLVVGAVNDQLGANPVEFLIRSTGDWTIRFLCLVLAVTPVRRVFNLPELARFRRMLGLFVYFYATLHFLCYAALDMAFDLTDVGVDIVKRPFILLGFLTWLMLTPLALTSFTQAVRWLGAVRWQQLHRLVYVIAFLAIGHFWWMRSAKHNFQDVVFDAAILGVLLGERLWRKIKVNARV